MKALFNKIFDENKKKLKQYQQVVDRANALEVTYSQISDKQISEKINEFKNQLSSKTNIKQILPEIFATVREAGKRALGLRHYDVQLIGGMALFEGNIAEMSTGEGKTLAATLAAYAKVVEGNKIHVVTVNEYLAQRDATWMKPLYEMLGLSVGVIQNAQELLEKQQAYQSDITYGTNNEFAFDYLRDNMVFSFNHKVQQQLDFAIIDEVDSILIDEARTPLIISGGRRDDSVLYKTINKIVPKFKLDKEIIEEESKLDQMMKNKESNEEEGDFIINRKSNSLEVTETGNQNIEKLLRKTGLLSPDDQLYDPNNIKFIHYVQAGLKAHYLYSRDIHYVIQQGQVKIIDEHTGRIMEGRRWSDGLHQAIEAKESVAIQQESEVLASITFQNYFLLYQNISGMTGTAKTEEEEFKHIYHLAICKIPTNKKNIRIDHNDKIYLTKQEKIDSIIEDIKEKHQQGRPVLVGTISVEDSEKMSQLLNQAGLTNHSVLNAKYHQQEAQIIAQAGMLGAITIATNMAGRGTDIILGGNLTNQILQAQAKTPKEIEVVTQKWQQMHDSVIEKEGLHIIGSARHESRRIDNQLRGRTARQGDPGSTCFYLSLEDDLLKVFIPERVKNIMYALNPEKNEPIEHRMLNSAIEKAQKKVEGHYFEVRKQLLEFDNITNEQRNIVYQIRNRILESNDEKNINQSIENSILDCLEQIISERFLQNQTMKEQEANEVLAQQIHSIFNIELDRLNQFITQMNSSEQLQDDIFKIIQKNNEINFAKVEDTNTLKQLKQNIVLELLDLFWKEHLQQVSNLKRSVHFRGYAQKDPRREFKKESFYLFNQTIDNINKEVSRVISHYNYQGLNTLYIETQQKRHQKQEQQIQNQQNTEQVEKQPVVKQKKPGRNELCFCDSGKKYKYCHGR